MTRLSALLAFGCISVLAPLFTGCATITRGTSEVLVVESEPSGATVRLSNGMVGTTPTSFKIHRKGAVTVSISKEGYEPAEINVNTQVAKGGAAGMAGNVLVGGLIGVGVDSFSGGMLEHKPNPVKLTLVVITPKPPRLSEPALTTDVPKEPVVDASAPMAPDVTSQEAVSSGDPPAVTVPAGAEIAPEALPPVEKTSEPNSVAPEPALKELATAPVGSDNSW